MARQNNGAGDLVQKGVTATLLMLIALLPDAAFAQSPRCSDLRITNSIELEKTEDGDPLRIPVTVAGKQRSFVFDLSGPWNWISTNFADDLGLKQLGSSVHQGPLSAPTANYVAAPVVLGTGKLDRLQFLVVDRPKPEVSIPYTDVISGQLFRGNDIDLDFGAGRLNFFATDHCEGRVVYWPHQALAVVPMTLEHGLIVIPVTLDGHKFRAIISTAEGRSAMNIEKAEIQLGYKPEPPNPRIPTSMTISYPNRFKMLEFDGVSIANPSIQMRLFRPGTSDPEGNFPSYYGALRSPEIIIGEDILRRLHMYVSFAEKRIYITEAGIGSSPLFPSAASH